MDRFGEASSLDATAQTTTHHGWRARLMTRPGSAPFKSCYRKGEIYWTMLTPTTVWPVSIVQIIGSPLSAILHNVLYQQNLQAAKYIPNWSHIQTPEESLLFESVNRLPRLDNIAIPDNLAAFSLSLTRKYGLENPVSMCSTNQGSILDMYKPGTQNILVHYIVSPYGYTNDQGGQTFYYRPEHTLLPYQMYDADAELDNTLLNSSVICAIHIASSWAIPTTARRNWWKMYLQPDPISKVLSTFIIKNDSLQKQEEMVYPAWVLHNYTRVSLTHYEFKIDYFRFGTEILKVDDLIRTVDTQETQEYVKIIAILFKSALCIENQNSRQMHVDSKILVFGKVYQRIPLSPHRALYQYTSKIDCNYEWIYDNEPEFASLSQKLYQSQGVDEISQWRECGFKSIDIKEILGRYNPHFDVDDEAGKILCEFTGWDGEQDFTNTTPWVEIIAKAKQNFALEI